MGRELSRREVARKFHGHAGLDANPNRLEPEAVEDLSRILSSVPGKTLKAETGMRLPDLQLVVNHGIVAPQNREAVLTLIAKHAPANTATETQTFEATADQRYG